MSNPSKAKGTHAETKVKNYFIEHGLRCERKALAGSDDEGDLRLYLNDGTEVTVEVKTGKQTHNYNRARLNEWKRQTLAESFNSGCKSILVITRHYRRFDDTEVWFPNEQWECDGMDFGWTMIYIDDFVKKFGTYSEELIGG